MQVSEWLHGANSQRESNNYDYGIRLGGTGRTSFAIYSFTLPKPEITSEVRIEQIRVTIRGQDGFWHSIPKLLIGNKSSDNELHKLEGNDGDDSVYTFSGIQARNLLKTSDDKLASQLNVGIDARTGFYDLRDIKVEFQYSGMSNEDLNRITFAIAGRALLNKSIDVQDSFWIPDLDSIQEPMNELIQGILLNQMVALAGAPLGEAAAHFAAHLFEKYVQTQFLNMRSWWQILVDQYTLERARLDSFTTYTNAQSNMKSAVRNLNDLIEEYYTVFEESISFEDKATEINYQIDAIL